MSSLFARLLQDLIDILNALFGPSGRKVTVLALDGNRVVRFDAESAAVIDQFITFNPSFQGGFGMCYGADGNLLIPMSYSGHVMPFAVGVQRFAGNDGRFLDTFAQWPLLSDASGYDNPDCATLGPDGRLYVGAGSFAPLGTAPIYRYDAHTGAFIDVFVPASTGGMECPSTLRFGLDGNLYVRNCPSLDSSLGYNILRFNGKTGAFMDIFVPVVAGSVSIYGGMTFGPDGHLYVGETLYGSIRRYDGTGALLGDFVPKGKANHPCGLIFFGKDLFVANAGTPYSSSTIGNISRYDGTTGELVQTYQLGGTDAIHPTDVLVGITDMPTPIVMVVGNWRQVPVWVKVVGAGILGALVGRIFASSGRESNR